MNAFITTNVKVKFRPAHFGCDKFSKKSNLSCLNEREDQFDVVPTKETIYVNLHEHFENFF